MIERPMEEKRENKTGRNIFVYRELSLLFSSPTVTGQFQEARAACHTAAIIKTCCEVGVGPKLIWYDFW
jgi:hypothetical protein